MCVSQIRRLSQCRHQHRHCNRHRHCHRHRHCRRIWVGGSGGPPDLHVSSIQARSWRQIQALDHAPIDRAAKPDAASAATTLGKSGLPSQWLPCTGGGTMLSSSVIIWCTLKLAVGSPVVLRTTPPLELFGSPPNLTKLPCTARRKLTGSTLPLGRHLVRAVM